MNFLFEHSHGVIIRCLQFGRTAKCYQSRQGDIDADSLYEIPSAPRTGVANGYPSSWDWGILNTLNPSNMDKTLNNFNVKISSAERHEKERKVRLVIVMA